MDVVFRAGVSFPRWGGVDRTSDPGAISPNGFYDLVNARIRGTDISCRGGQSQFDPDGSGVNGCPGGIWPADYEPVGPFLQMRSAVAWGAQNALWKYDIGADVGSLTYTAEQIDNLIVPDVIWSDGDEVLVGVAYGKVYSVRGGNIALFLDLGLAVEMHVTGIAKIGSTYYFAVADNTMVAANAKVYSWDGVSAAATVDNSPNLQGAFGLFAYGSDLFAYWSEGVNFAPGDVNSIRHRDSGGTWSTLTFPGGITSALFYSAAAYSSKVYFAGKGDPGAGLQCYVMVWDSITPTIVSVANGPFGTTAAKCKRVCVFDSKLTYLWHEDPAGADNHVAYLGDYNGTTWTDARKNFVTQFFPAQRPREGFGLAGYQGNLYAMMDTFDSGSGLGAMLIRSPGTNTAGAWEGLELDPTSTYEYFGFDYQDGMVVGS